MPRNAKEITNVKVVHLEPDSQRVARARIARLPAAIHAVHEKTKYLLQQRLKSFFDMADDSLFSLADKASSNQEQNIFFDSMREVRVQRRGLEKRFGAELDAAFARLATGDTRNTLPTIDETIDSDSLSLVKHSDLEEMVAIESSVNRAASEYADGIQQLSLRLDTLVKVKVYQQNNPIGPEVLANAFMAQAERLDIDIKAKLVLFKLFDKSVMQGLGPIYKAANDILIEHNVLPSLTQARRTPNSVHSLDQSSAEAPSSAQGDVLASTAEGTANREVVSLLQGLLAEQQQSSLRSSAASDVVKLLSLAQQAPVPIGNFRGGVNALDLITELQQRSGSTATIGRTEQEVVNLVDMLFNFILEDKNLADLMKEQISRMQIPLVKVALLDRSFFAKGGHAARRLLNEMATAALGWQPGEPGSKPDALYSKVNEVVSTLLTRFDTDVSIFNELLADFSSFVEKDRRRAEVLERRTLDAEDGKAKAQTARTIVAIEVELRTIDQLLPEVVKKLINGPWSNVLFLHNLKNGAHSSEWLEALQTLEDLVWSAQIPTSNEDRKRLIRLVPDLLQRLRQGLDVISFNPFEMSEIFKELEDVHLARIRGKREEVVVGQQDVSLASGSVPESDTAAGPIADAEINKPLPLANSLSEGELDSVQSDFETAELEEAEDLLADIDAVLASAEDVSPNPSVVAPNPRTQPPSPSLRSSPPVEKRSAVIPTETPSAVKAAQHTLSPHDPYMQQVANFVQGAWFELTDEAGAVSRCRLAAVIKPTGQYIFINRNGMKVAEKPQQELAQLLQQNRIRALDNSMLFDRALETVVSSLRKPT